MAIPPTSQFVVPDRVRWLLCSSSAWQRVRNPRFLSHFHASNVLQQPQERNHSHCQLCATPKESSAPEKAGLRRRLPSCFQNMWPPKGLKTCTSHPGAASGHMQLRKKSKKAITALTLVTEEPYPPISFDFFNSQDLYAFM